MSFCLVFVFSPTTPIHFHTTSFLFNCYSAIRASHTPSVNKGSKGLLLPSLPATCLLKGTAVSFTALSFFHHSNFSHSIVFELIANPA
jgi:hypothetical protein